MQLLEAQERQRQWQGKKCSHPNFEKEYYLSADTGDFVCTQCGQAFTKDEKETVQLNRPV